MTRLDSYVTILFDQNVSISHRDWSSNLAECHFITLVTGFYSFAQVFPHTYIPTFSSICYNLTWSQIEPSVNHVTTNTPLSLEKVKLNMIIDSEFTESLLHKNSLDYIALYSNLENFVIK